MNIFTQSDKRARLSQDDENKILLLQYNIGKIDKSILNFFKLKKEHEKLTTDFNLFQPSYGKYLKSVSELQTY